MAREVGTRAEGEKREGWEGEMGSIWAATCSRTVENKRKWRSRGGKSLPPPAFAASEFQLLLRAAWEGAPRPLLLPRAGSSASSREEREAGPLLTVLVVRHGRL
jgi:hypothetical protein